MHITRILAVILLVSACLAAHNFQAEDSATPAEKEQAIVESLRKQIEVELETLDRATLNQGHWAKEWAGEYCCGDGLGMNVTIAIAPKTGVVYTWYGCLGLYDS